MARSYSEDTDESDEQAMQRIFRQGAVRQGQNDAIVVPTLQRARA